MSLSRTALRLAAIEALAPTAAHPSVGNPSGGPWPTIARQRVFDAKMDTYDDLAQASRAPSVSIYTDDDVAEPAQRGGGPSFDRVVDVCFEMSIAVKMEDPDNPAEYIPSVPVTDPESEASLDLLEASIRYTLFYGASGAIFRKACGERVLKIETWGTRTAEEGIRLAMRTMKMRVRVKDDCYDLAPIAALTGLDRLPEPLQTIAKLLPEDSYGRAIASQLADFSPAAPVSTPGFTLQTSIEATVPADPEADPDVVVDITPPTD